LFPSVFLDSELLLDGAYLSGGVGVEVGLLEFFNQLINFSHVGFDYALLAFDSKRDAGTGFYAYGSVEIIVAIF
jgi:hypothetical protein